MTDATTEFFEKLARRRHEPLLKKVTGIMRFDLAQGTRTDHYFVAVKHGAVALSDENVEADCVVRADRSLFDGIASGEENLMAAMLRGALTFQGNPHLLLAFQRLFPGPPSSRAQQGTTSSGRRQ
jgi:putative sterol carrier protein